jgi:hypothetical protein
MKTMKMDIAILIMAIGEMGQAIATLIEVEILITFINLPTKVLVIERISTLSKMMKLSRYWFRL